MNKVKIGIIGIGNMGSAHLQCLRQQEVQGLEAAAVCDIDSSRLAAVHREYPELPCYEDYRDLLADASIDAVIISVPHPMHAEIGIAAFARGKHVLVEKPVDIRVSAAKRLNAAAQKSGKIFGIMFNQRTNGLYQEARRIVQSGELGELKRSVWIVTNWYRTQAYYDSGSWRATWKGEGGGVLLNQAPHNLDLWQWICGMPSSVTAFLDTGKYHSIEVEDDAAIYTRYENGATGLFLTSTGEAPGTNRLEISGTLGKLVLENGILKHWRLLEDEREVCKNSTEGFCQIESAYTEYTTSEESAHRGILQNFANAILHGEALLAPGYEGINELTLSNAAYLSQWKGNETVRLPFDTGEFDALLAERAASSRFSKPASGTASKISLPPSGTGQTAEAHGAEAGQAAHREEIGQTATAGQAAHREEAAKASEPAAASMPKAEQAAGEDEYLSRWQVRW